jgi:phosphoglycolate phosphatase-like HAD superfamily hydrolase
MRKYGGIKSIGFDFDGTLVDSLGFKLENAGKIFSEKFSVDGDLVIELYQEIR